MNILALMLGVLTAGPFAQPTSSVLLELEQLAAISSAANETDRLDLPGASHIEAAQALRDASGDAAASLVLLESPERPFIPVEGEPAANSKREEGLGSPSITRWAWARHQQRVALVADADTPALEQVGSQAGLVAQQHGAIASLRDPRLEGRGDLWPMGWLLPEAWRRPGAEVTLDDATRYLVESAGMAPHALDALPSSDGARLAVPGDLVVWAPDSSDGEASTRDLLAACLAALAASEKGPRAFQVMPLHQRVGPSGMEPLFGEQAPMPWHVALVP